MEAFAPPLKEWIKPNDEKNSVYLIARCNSLSVDAVSDSILFFHEIETSIGIAAKTTEFEIDILQWDGGLWGIVTLSTKHIATVTSLAKKAQFKLVNAVPSRINDEGGGERVWFPLKGKNVYTVVDVKK